tara:strand:- start:1086 stop:1898 length:813 start_codon:yes stop_codon:yes gene_type:complete
MDELLIHKEIKDKLQNFISKKKIPHIIFYGESGSGKRHILDFFIDKIYENGKDNVKNYIMYVNCAHSKGIRFFRDELKFFAKTNIQNKHGDFFKSIILFNADKLTTDAQSALRRCIEKYSHTTRFFIIVENKDKLLKPILSRFCDIYVPRPLINGKRQNLHFYNLQIFKKTQFQKKRETWLKNNVFKKTNYDKLINCFKFAEKMYEKAYSAIDLFPLIKKMQIKDTKKYLYLLHFDEIRREFRNEKLLIFYILYYVFMRPEVNLENIEIM